MYYQFMENRGKSVIKSDKNDKTYFISELQEVT